MIERTEHAGLIEANRERIEANKELYRKRQAIVEHPYGVIKRQWDFYYIMTMKHAAANVGMIFMAYNQRRIFNMIDHKTLKMYLKVLGWFYSNFISAFELLLATIFATKTTTSNKRNAFFMASDQLYLTQIKEV